MSGFNQRIQPLRDLMKERGLAALVLRRNPNPAWAIAGCAQVMDRENAIDLGEKRDQISIWDVVKSEEIQIGGSGQIDEPKKPIKRIKRKSINDDSTPRQFWGNDTEGDFGMDSEFLPRHRNSEVKSNSNRPSSDF